MYNFCYLSNYCYFFSPNTVYVVDVYFYNEILCNYFNVNLKKDK